ncbi:hypothetical protein [Streptomyces sp. NPDC006446]|uniref:hypothetical protein n=1 Tax=Streptomyces sp. NPDC006446 TaxID=3154301 RepID=UPI0033A337AF
MDGRCHRPGERPRYGRLHRRLGLVGQQLDAHRYQVYLSFMHAAADQLAAQEGWPSGAAPDLLECALFNVGWETSG